MKKREVLLFRLIFCLFLLISCGLFYILSVKSLEISYINRTDIFKILLLLILGLFVILSTKKTINSTNPKEEVKNICIIFLILAVPFLISRLHLNEIAGLKLNLSLNYKIFDKIALAASVVWAYQLLSVKKISLIYFAKHEKIFVWGTVVFFSLLYFILTSRTHYKFGTTIFDLGIYDNKAWTFSQFLPQYSSILEMKNFADHFEPILFIVGILYRIIDSVYVLLFFEAAIVALAFVPIYYLAKNILKSGFAGYFIGLSFLVFMGILNAIAYPVHPGTWLPTFYLFAIFFAYQKKYIYYYLFLLLALSSKESAFVHILFIGILVFLVFKNRLQGIITIIISLLAYILVFKIIMFNASGGLPYAHGVFSSISNNPVDFVKYIISHPYQTIKILLNQNVKPETILLTLGSTGFLAVFSPVFLILVVPMFIERLLADHFAMARMSFHYSAPIAYAIVLSTIFSIKYLQKKYGIGVAKPLAMFVFISSFLITISSPQYRSPLLVFLNKSNFILSQSDREAYYIINKVPKDVSIISQDAFGPHLTHRQKIGLFGGNGTGKFDYVLLSKTPSYSTWPATFTAVLEETNYLRNNENYEIVSENSTLILFKKL